MSKCEDVLDSFVKLFFFLGLFSTERRNFKQMAKVFLFVIAVPVMTIFLAVAAYNIQSVKDKLVIVQIIPAGLMVTVKAYSVSRSIEKIKRLVEDLKQMLRHVDDPGILANAHNQAMKIMKICFFVNVFSPTIAQTISLIVHENFIPTWIPEQFTEYKESAFYFYWIIYTFCGFYMSTIAIMIDFLMLYVMILMNAFSKFLLKKFKSLPSKEATERNEQFLNLIRLTEALRM